MLMHTMPNPAVMPERQCNKYYRAERHRAYNDEGTDLKVMMLSIFCGGMQAGSASCRVHCGLPVCWKTTSGPPGPVDSRLMNTPTCGSQWPCQHAPAMLPD